MAPARYAFAQRISQVFNPLAVITAVMVLAVVRQAPSAGHALIDLAIGLFFGVLVPLGYVLGLRYRGDIGALFIPERDLRVGPLAVAAVSCWMGVAALWWAGAPSGVLATMLCFAAQVTLMLGLTGRTKVSLHAAGAWGGWMMLAIFWGKAALAALPLPLAVGWARLTLGAHTVAQVVLGSAVGLALTWVIFRWVMG